MSAFMTSALATFAYVFLRSFQQLNVVHGRYWAVFPVSILMGLGDATIMLLIVKADTVWIGASNGVAGGCGAMIGMWLHRRLGKRKVETSS